MIDLSVAEEGRAMSLHRDSIVVDTHNDTIQDIMAGTIPHAKEYSLRRTLGERSKEGQIDIPRIRDGGVDCLMFAMVVSRAIYQGRRLRRLHQMLDMFYSEIEKNSSEIALATTYGDVVNLAKEGRIAAIISIEGVEALEGDIGALRMLYKLGVRSITLTHFARNELGDGSRDDSGSHLTEFGFEVVREMNRLGMIIDISHINETGFWDVIKNTKSPVIASHSNCKALSDHHRNLTDDQIRAVAKNGGVVNLSYCGGFIKQGVTRENLREVTIDDWLDHVDHINDLVGSNHMGLGSDFDGGCGFPGMDDITKVPEITRGLVSRGYSDGEISHILGGNDLRVFEKVLG
jgi:membrane dipeptidase